jgi:hypothetical protein
MCGPDSSSSSTSQASNQTTVNVSTPINVDTSSLADAVEALSGTQAQAAQLALIGQIYTANAAAGATVQAAQLAAAPSTTQIILVLVAIGGFLVTAGFISFKKRR